MLERQSLYRIVLIEDSEWVRLGLREQLNRTAEFHVVGEAASADEGVESVARLSPDLVLLDLSLPDVSGVEACRRMLAVRPDTRVLMLSVHDALAQIPRRGGARLCAERYAGRHVARCDAEGGG
jgi:two-component system response regulator DevR